MTGEGGNEARADGVGQGMRQKRGRRRIGRVRRTIQVVLVALIAFALAEGCAMISMPGERWEGPPPPLTPTEERLAERLRADVEHLATAIGPRALHGFQGGLDRARDFIESSLREVGYETERELVPTPFEHDAHNVIAELAGSGAKSGCIVVGAHYDTCFNTPGANDNASGVAVLLALARLAAERSDRPARKIRWVAFVNEEPPWFQTEAMGSRVHAAGCRARGEDVVAMVSLETVGFYSEEPESQKYPWPFSLFYPSVGDFIGFVGNTRSRKLVRDLVGSFREHARFPSEGAAVPGRVPGVGWSDHWSFWQEGYPAVMLTDTAPFRYEHYHEVTDTPDRLDYGAMSRITTAMDLVLRDVAAR